MFERSAGASLGKTGFAVAVDEMFKRPSLTESVAPSIAVKALRNRLGLP